MVNNKWNQTVANFALLTLFDVHKKAINKQFKEMWRWSINELVLNYEDVWPSNINIDEMESFIISNICVENSLSKYIHIFQKS